MCKMTIAKKNVLGKGLGKGLGIDRVIPNKIGEKNNLQSEEVKKQEIYVDIAKVEPNSKQPRKKFNEDALLELSESIKQFGILQPLLVQKKEDYYEIIAGERRWRAAKLAGLKEVPVLVKKLNEQEILEISLIENIQRENLNPIEEAIAFKRLLDEFHLKQDELAERVAKSRTAITNAIRLLKLDERVQQMVVDEKITTGHARAVLAITQKEEQYMIAQKIFDEKLSVRETEKLVKKIQSQKEIETQKKKNENDTLSIIYQDLEQKLKNIMGTKVFIHQKNNDKGKIEIEYENQGELERIMELFASIHEV